MNPRTIATAAFAVAASGGLLAWRAAAPPTPTAHAAVLYDRSESATGGCAALVGAVEDAMAAGTISRRSVVEVLGTGDDDTAGEPVEIARLVGLASGRAVEGARGALARHRAVLGSVEDACRATRPARVSPVYLGARRAIEGLRSRGCGPGGRCRLTVVSDLEENVEPGLAARIRGKREEAALPRLDNAGIDVLLCGTSETRGPPDGGRRARTRTSGRADRLRDAWRSVFTAPELVRFEPHCPCASGSKEGAGR